MNPWRSVKIFVNEQATLDQMVDKIVKSDAARLILNIPKDAKISETVSNFHVLKREAERFGKTMSVESVDERVLELCEASRIEAVNPIFKNKRRAVSDIIPNTPSFSKMPANLAREEFFTEKTDDKRKQDEKPSLPPDDLSESPGGKGESENRAEESEAWEPEEAKISDIFRNFPLKKFVTMVCIIAGAGMIGYIALAVLPKAEIRLKMKRVEVSFEETVEASKNISSFTVSPRIKLAGELFSQNKSLSLTFKASGRENVERKAKGIITIYNGYSSEPQVLVANTRFETPEGKIFRITEKIIVPGAKVSEGKIIPSSLEAEVTADRAGEAFNIGPVGKFTIPGFKGSPKFQGFYAQSSQPMKGGFVGEMAVPTEEDKKRAFAQIEENLRGELEKTVFAQLPQDFKVIDGARSFKILKKEIDENVDQEGNFPVKAEAEMQIVGFREKELQEAVFGKYFKNEIAGDYEVVGWTAEYGLARADFKEGIISFPMTGVLTSRRKADIEGLRNQIVRKKESELKALVFSIPGLENATISLWPFWVRRVPGDVDRVTVNLE